MQTCTDVQFDAQVAAWCSEIERTCDYSNFPLLCSRISTQTSTNNKLAALVGFVVDEIEKKQCKDATHALLLALKLDPVPTRLLSKHYTRLHAYFEQRIDSIKDACASKCFALLPSMLLKPDWPKTFDGLAAMLQLTLQKKNLTAFQNCIVALVEFFCERRCAIQPGKLVLACRKAMDVNFDFSRSALCLMEDLVRRLGRGALAWANVLCEALEVCFDEPALRLSAYITLTCFQENLGLAVCTKFAPVLVSAVKQDWSNKNITDGVLFAGLTSVSALYQSGAGSVLPVALRTELDSMVFEAANSGALRNVKLRATFLDCLALACTTPTLEGDSAMLRLAVTLFQHIAADAAEDTRVVKPSARRALAVCAFRACSALPPIRHIVVSDTLATQQFASTAKPANAASAQDTFSAAAARFTSNQVAVEEPMTQPVTQEETTSSSSEEEEEEEQPVGNKRLQLMTPNAAAAAAETDDSDDDIPDIV